MSDELDKLLALERKAMVPAAGVALATSTRLGASIAAGAPTVVDMPPSAVASSLSAQVGWLSVLGWSIAGVLVAGGVWIAISEQSPQVEAAPPPGAETKVVTTSTSTTVATPLVPDSPARATNTKRSRTLAPRPRIALKPPTPPPTPEVAPPLPAPAPARLGEELALVRRAQVELKRGVPAAALAAVLEHEAKFPKGALAEERWALKAIVLCRLGRRDEGGREAEGFLKAHPSSPQALRVRGACTGE